MVNVFALLRRCHCTSKFNIVSILHHTKFKHESANFLRHKSEKICNTCYKIFLVSSAKMYWVKVNI